MKAKKPTSCIVCFEDFAKYMKPVPCPSCPNSSPPSVCKTCTEEYLLSSPQDAHCMQCKHAWGYQFMHETFSSTFITKTYRQNRQEKSLEREKGLLQQTLPLVAEEKERKEALERMKVFKDEARALKAEYTAKLRVIEAKMREEAAVVKHGKAVDVKGPQYLFPCPVMGKEKTQCRGFIEAGSWCCGLCETEVCKKCHCVSAAVSGKKHKCKKEDVETAKMVMEDSKPCPKCKVRIFKLSGCDQMFCTQCSTPFSWNTGEIVTGVIHNPHYYEMMRKTGIAPRNAGDAPCGGMPWFDQLYDHAKVCSDYTREVFTNLHRRCSEIEDHIRRERRKLENARGLEDVRLRWLLGGFKDEKTWQKSIFIRERNINKKREELAILDTFITGAIERFNDYNAKCAEMDDKKLKKAQLIEQKRAATAKMMEDIEQIRQFCNTAFEENFKALVYKQWPVIDFSGQYGKKRTIPVMTPVPQDEDE